MRGLLVFLLMLYCGCVQAQFLKIDSADLYMAKADTFAFLEEKFEDAIVNYERAAQLYEKKKEYNKLLTCNYMLAEITFYIDPNQSLKYCLKAQAILEFIDEGKDFYNMQVNWYLFLINQYNHDYTRAETYVKKLIRFIENSNDYRNPNDYTQLAYERLALGRIGSKDRCLRNHSLLQFIIDFYQELGRQTECQKLSEFANDFASCIKSENKDKILENENIQAFRNGNYNELLESLFRIGEQVQIQQTYPKLQKANFDFLISKTYTNLGMFKQGIKYAESALSLQSYCMPSGFRLQPKLYNNIGSLYRQLGAYDQTLRYYKQAYQLILRNKGKVNFSAGSVSNNIGETYYALGNYKEALNWHQQALDIRLHIADHPYRTNSYDNLGMTYLKLGDLDQAKLYLQKGLVLREQFPKTIQYERYYIKSYTHLAEWYQLTQQPDKALTYFYKALNANLSDSKDDQLAKYIVWNQIGKLEFERERYSAALNAFEEALRSNVDDATRPLHAYISSESLLQSLKGKAQVFTQKGELTQALTNYELAIELLDKTRKAFSTQQDKLFMSSKSRSVYEGAMDVAYQLYLSTQDDHYLARMFAISEQSKAGTLLDAQNLQQAKHHVLPDSVLEKESRLSALISYYQQRVKSSKPGEVGAWEQRLFETKREQEALNLSLEKHFPTYYQLKYQARHVTVRQVQEQLQDQEVLLEFFVGKNEVYAFRLDKTDFDLKVLPKPSLSSIQQFRHAILNQDWENYSANCAAFIHYSHQLYTNLIEPFGKLSAQKLVIIPDGMLWHVNFDLLLKEQPADEDYRSFRYLMRDVAIRYGYSGAHLIQSSTKSINYSGGLLAFAPSYESLTGSAQKLEGLGKFRNEVGVLKHNQEEVIQIAAQIDGDVYTGYDAVETKFKTELVDHSILHLAMHALIDNADPNNSRLVFTHDEDTMEDNFLHVYELYHMKMPVDLAVLSACNTGFGKLEGGEGLMSLGRAFAYAGCPAVVMSQWKVDDLATSDLMNRFYENLASGMEKSVALQQAKLNYLESSGPREALPFLWGSFVLLGDDSVIKVETKSNYLLGGIAFLGIVLLLGITIWKR